jgi:hypothetical protein
MFPIIKHTDDLLPHIKDRTDINATRDEVHDLIAFNYGIVTGWQMFDSPYIKECRGIKFKLSTGELLARP